MTKQEISLKILEQMFAGFELKLPNSFLGILTVTSIISSKDIFIYSITFVGDLLLAGWLRHINLNMLFNGSFRSSLSFPVLLLLGVGLHVRNVQSFSVEIFNHFL